MIVLNKKRILLIVFTVMIAVLITPLQYKDISIDTVALLVSNKVIVLDAGHRRAR